MAYLIPDNLRASPKVPAHHRRVVSLLATGLDDSATAWYEPPFDPSGRRPHLLVLDPELGVLAIDILDHQRGDTVEGVDGRAVQVRGADGVRTVTRPMERARRYAEEVRAALAERAHLKGVPVVALLAATHLAAAEATGSGLDHLVDPAHLITRDDHDAALDDETDTLLYRRLRRAGRIGHTVKTAQADTTPLDATALAEVRALLHPDAVITAEPTPEALFTPAELGDDDVIKVMDRRQERLAKSLGTGHRVIRGVAGSGKTLVLVHRARTLARLLPGQPILVTCYTRSLASHLRTQLDELDNVEVTHLYSLMGRVIAKAGMPQPRGRNAWDALPGQARAALREVEGLRYRAVMVDEAQDFATESLAFCVDLLQQEDPSRQDLVIVADSAQNIFRRDFRWRDAGINAQGRTRVLRVNYRNTREILAFAHGFLAADRDLTFDDSVDGDDEVALVPAEASERSGPEPVVVAVDMHDEVEAVVAQVHRWHEGGTPAGSIAVLVHWREHRNLAEPIRDALHRAGIDVFWLSDPSLPANKDAAGSTSGRVVLSSVPSAKGLEYPKVVVCGVGSAPAPTKGELIADRKALYVGFTRAVDELTVVTTRDNPFSRDLLRCTHLQPA